ncbi:hypothetical protein Trydic_g17358 [Trypoxylus dichotomus]
MEKPVYPIRPATTNKVDAPHDHLRNLAKAGVLLFGAISLALPGENLRVHLVKFCIPIGYFTARLRTTLPLCTKVPSEADPAASIVYRRGLERRSKR